MPVKKCATKVETREVRNILEPVVSLAPISVTENFGKSEKSTKFEERT